MEEIDWYNTSKHTEEVLDTQQEIFQYIYDMVTTYPQEISEKLGYSLRTVQHYLRKMHNENRIGIIATPFEQVQGRIRYRIAGLWAEGMTGSDIRKRTWYCTIETGAELESRLYDEHGVCFHKARIGKGAQ